MKTKNARVFVVNLSPNTPLGKLSDHTDLPPIILTSGYVKLNEQTKEQIADTLESFQAGRDLLLLSGSAAIAALTVAILAETYNITTFKILLYHKRSNSYTMDIIDGQVA